MFETNCYFLQEESPFCMESYNCTESVNYTKGLNCTESYKCTESLDCSENFNRFVQILSSRFNYMLIGWFLYFQYSPPSSNCQWRCIQLFSSSHSWRLRRSWQPEQSKRADCAQQYCEHDLHDLLPGDHLQVHPHLLLLRLQDGRLHRLLLHHGPVCLDGSPQLWHILDVQQSENAREEDEEEKVHALLLAGLGLGTPTYPSSCACWHLHRQQIGKYTLKRGCLKVLAVWEFSQYILNLGWWRFELLWQVVGSVE